MGAIFRLDTSYGGGKTHGLIALAHAAGGMTGVSDLGEFIDPGLLPAGPVRVAAFDGENADPANGRALAGGVLAYTPWGEIAHALAGKPGYERVRRSDEQRVAPGAETLRALFGDAPTLILLDELSVYLRKVSRLDDARGQLTAFLTSLFKAVESTPNAALVYTLAIGKDGHPHVLETLTGKTATLANFQRCAGCCGCSRVPSHTFGGSGPRTRRRSTSITSIPATSRSGRRS